MSFTIPAESPTENSSPKSGFTIPVEEKGLIGRITEDWEKRNQQLGDIAVSSAKGQPLPITGLRTAANITGRGIDTSGEVAKSIWQSDPNEPIQKAITKGIAAVGETAPVQATAKAYSEWKKNHPDAADALESVINLGAIFPSSKVIKGGIESADTLVAKAAKEKAEKAIVKALPSVDTGLIPVAKLAQKYNIPLSLDEITGSRALKVAQKAGQDLPFSGQNAFREKQMSAWNKGILNTIGEKGDRITPETMKAAYTRLGAEFDKLGKGKVFNIGQPFDVGINEIRNEYGIFKKPDGSIIASSKTRDAVESFENTVDEIKREANPDGTISGEKLNKMRAKVNKYIRDSDNYDTKILLGDLENHIIDTMTSDPAIAKSFAKTKNQYKNFIALEPLVQKGKAGNISPVNLSNRVARIYGRSYTTGEAGELARIGRELLPELAGSDTYAKSVLGLSAAGGALMHPIATGAVLGGNRAFQSGINRNQALIRKAIENSPGQYLGSPLDTPIENIAK